MQKPILFFLFTLILHQMAVAEPSSIERGRYLAIVSGCNDCHTAGYAPSGGKVPENDWLKGDAIGWRGPWGTTYAINLRTLVNSLTPEAWLTLTKNSQARPPMPSYVFKVMSDQDLRSLYDFIKSLGASGEVMPTALPPGEEPKTPYFNFVPVMPGSK